MSGVARPTAGVIPGHDSIAVPDFHMRMVTEAAATSGFGGIKHKHHRTGDGENSNPTANVMHETAHGEAFPIPLL
jgi:hypothetical protein